MELTPDNLLDLVDPKNIKYLNELGGIDGLAQKLAVDVKLGLSGEDLDLQARREFYGTNKLPEPISKSFLMFVWEALQDKTLLVLLAAAAVELGIGVYKFKFAPEADRQETALIDGAAILVAGISTLT